MPHLIRNRKRHGRQNIAKARQLAIKPKARHSLKGIPVNPSRRSKDEDIKTEPASLLARFNAPNLLHRRTAAIALANAGFTKESDDALENILAEFEKLSF